MSFSRTGPQTEFHLVPNLSVHGKYNLISVWFNKIPIRFLCVCTKYFSPIGWGIRVRITLKSRKVPPKFSSWLVHRILWTVFIYFTPPAFHNGCAIQGPLRIILLLCSGEKIVDGISRIFALYVIGILISWHMSTVNLTRIFLIKLLRLYCHMTVKHSTVLNRKRDPHNIYNQRHTNDRHR